MKKRLLYFIYSLLFFLPATALAQTATPVTLGSSPYTENFDNIGTAMPNGFAGYTAASSTSLGTVGTVTTTAGATTYWSATGAGFKNFASADGQPSAGTTSTADQGTATNRAFGVRQTSAAGYDPGAALIFQVANTTGKKSFKLSFALQSLDISTAVTRTTTWVVDYGIGAAPTTFTPATTIGTMTTGNMVFSDNTITVDFGSALDNVSDIVTIRVVALTGSAGSNSRASTAIDDWSLAWSPLVAATPTLIATPTTVNFATPQNVGSTSATAQTFTLSGTNLTTDASLVVTGPYTISVNGGAYGTSATITQVLLATAQTVSVKFTPTASGASTGSIAITAGAATQTVTLTGTGAAQANPSVITVTPATLTFPSQVINTTSAAQFFNFSATNVSDVFTATATGPYLVSKDGLAFSNVVTYTTTDVALSPKVYVQFTPTAVNAVITGTVVINTSNAVAAKTVTLSGAGVATPAPPAGIANHVVISQMYGAGNSTGATYLNDYLELYNPTNADIDMAGWSIQYQAAATSGAAYSGVQPITAAASTTASAPNGNTIIKAHGYYLLQENSATPVPSIGVALPVTPDIAGTLLNFSGSTGKIALVNTITPIIGTPPTPTAVVDFLGYGTTPNYGEGWVSGAAVATYAAPAPSITTNLVRRASANATSTSMASGGADYLQGNGYDSNVNLNDFILVPTGTLPIHNSASAVQPALTPAYTATPNALTFNQNINTVSAGTPFVLTGTGILPATSVGTTAPYTVSKTATGGYSTAISFTATEMAANPTVYVQFAPTALGAANSVINITGVGAVPVTVALTGTGTAVPVATLTATPATLAFPATTVGVTAAALTYTLSGTNITQPTVVTLTGPYAVSKDGITFTPSITFANTELNAGQAPKVYVQFTPTAVGANAGTTVQTTIGGGTTITTVTLSGTGIAPPNTAPTLAVIPDQTGCYTTAQQTVALTGITPGTETTQLVNLTVTTNNPLLFSSIGALAITSGSSAINYTVANGKSGTAVVTVKLKDNGGIANSGIDTLIRTFNITVVPLPVLTITSDAPGNVLEKGNVATITAAGGVSYAWTAATSITSGLTGSSITVRPNVFTSYKVAITNSCGLVTTLTLGIEVRNAFKLETSNVITPNGDGKNDFFVVRNIDLYPGNTVKIFDKTGKLLYTKTGYNNDWNGYYNGSPLSQGTYYYVVDLGTGLPYRGVISVVRD
jgi:gliding motility-associated-like protein